MAKHEELSKKLEQLAKFYIAADSGDRETLIVIAGRLEEISGLAAAESLHACAAAAAKAAHRFGLSLQEAAGGAEWVIAVAGKSMSAIQMVVDENRPEADSDFPVELGIIIPEQAETEAIEKIYNALYEFSLITKKSTKDGIYSLVMSSSRILNRILSRRIKDNNLVPYVLGAIISVVDELQNDAIENGKNGKHENEIEPAQTVEAEEKALRQDDDILKDFFEESVERLDASEEQLLLLEKDISLKESVNIIFRAFHSMKGVSGFLKISDVHAISREAENILEYIRRGELAVTPGVIGLFLEAVDLLKAIILEHRERWKQGKPFLTSPGAGAIIAKMRGATGNNDLTQFEGFDGGEETGAPDKEIREVQKQQASEDVLRVDSRRLGRLIDSIGELVINEAMFGREAQQVKMQGPFLDRLRLISKTTKQLQEFGISLRLVSLKRLFMRIARAGRDAALACAKNVNITLSGEETEMDRSIVERMSDPLLHMIRNAIDHGIEKDSTARAAMGKAPQGNIAIRAFQRSGNIFIEMTDDGRGFDREAVKKSAGRKKPNQENGEMTDSKMLEIICLPGFSTAEEITDISGRGVGMDVVKREVETLNGSLELATEQGKGSTIRIILPLTSAIIEGLTIVSGKEHYIIPSLSIVESIKIEPGMVSQVAGNGRMLVSRDAIVPVFSLESLFHEESKDNFAGNIAVIVENNNKKIALLVDHVLEPRQVVIKSMPAGLGKINGIAACTVLPDGRVGLILD